MSENARPRRLGGTGIRGALLLSIYYDNSATTRTREEAAQIICRMLTEEYGNPSSLHRLGFSAQQKMEEARKQLADTLGCTPGELTFTSGGTESDNLAILGAAAAHRRQGNRVVTTAIEHDAVLRAMDQLEQQGWEVIRLKPDSQGNITAQQVADAVDEKTVLVSVMAVNNEVGSILPIPEICKLVRRKNPKTLLHCDAVQAFGKHPIRLKKNAFDVDMLTISGHKIYGPKGIGALYLRRGVRLSPLLFGGGQEKNLRPGTENIAYACALGCCAQLVCAEQPHTTERVSAIRQALWEGLEKLPGVRINSDLDGTPYILNCSVEGVRSEIMLHFMEEKGIYLSSGSACAKGEASHVLTAMGLPRSQADSALRLSFGRENTPEQVPVFLQALEEAIARFRR